MSLPYVGENVLQPSHKHLYTERQNMQVGSDSDFHGWSTKLPGNKPRNVEEGEVIPNFTATGRPFAPGKSNNGSALSALNSTDYFTGGSINLLPRRYTDDSPICIAVLPASAVKAAAAAPAAYSPSSPTTPSTYTSYTISTEDDNPIKHESSSSGFKFWRSRKSSTSSAQHLVSGTSAPPKKSKKEKPGVDFVMKSIPRGVYLKHYAKDEQGRYIGTEAPADDCILRNADDLQRWRNPATAWKNELS